MWWMKREEGATVITVAITLLVLFGTGALVLDAGNLFWERRQLQNAADAAALAAAWDLALGEPEAVARESARDYASDNSTRGAFVEGFEPDYTASEITITTRTGTEDEAGHLVAWLAGVIGHDTYFTRAQATASWGPIGGAATIPITFSWCEWEALVGDIENPTLPTDSKVLPFLTPGGEDCKGPAGHYAPGGWGWLASDDCMAEIHQGEVDGRVSQGLPTAHDPDCTPSYFQSLVGQEVLMPIFEQVTGVGAGATYTIIGFAAVEIEGYRLHAGNPAWAANPPCTNPNTCIQARFIRFLTLAEAAEFGGGPDFGTSTVALTR